MKDGKVYLLAHSGVAVEYADRVLVFDAWRDPRGHLERLAATDKDMYFFVTHAHGDHFVPELGRIYGERAAAFVLSNECVGGSFPRAKTRYAAPGDVLTVADMRVRTYGSTDSGGSFHVASPVGTVYHAGDLNWWHWTADPDEDNRVMRKMFFEELGKLAGMRAELVFFPVDNRQGPAQEWGIIEFLQALPGVPERLLVPVHRNGAPWVPSLYWQWRFAGVPVWLGLRDGDVREV